MNCCEFVQSYVQLMYNKCHKINPYRGGSYVDSPDWIKNKKTTTYPINKKDKKCFQCATTVALNYDDIRKQVQKCFTNKYKWEGKNFLSEKGD